MRAVGGAALRLKLAPGEPPLILGITCWLRCCALRGRFSAHGSTPAAQEVRMEASRGINGRFVGLGAASGATGGVVMAMWVMVYSGASHNGFWTPLNVCMASFMYRSEGSMMIHDMLVQPA